MKEYAKSFYQGKQWKEISRLYMASQNYICERCGGVGAICHHRVYINPSNINDPNITLSLYNLECLCQTCHNREHSATQPHNNGVAFDEYGNLVKAPDVLIVCGAPGSGKSTYVRQHMNEQDIIFDLDNICAALMGTDELYSSHDYVLQVALDMREAFYKSIEGRRGKWRKAWIITSTTDAALLQTLAFRLKADIFTMPTTLQECIDRINADQRRKNKALFIQLAKNWYAAHEGS